MCAASEGAYNWVAGSVHPLSMPNISQTIGELSAWSTVYHEVVPGQAAHVSRSFLYRFNNFLYGNFPALKGQHLINVLHKSYHHNFYANIRWLKLLFND